MSLFIATAADRAARENLRETIERGLPVARARGLRSRTLIDLHSINGLFYCWGATSGRTKTPNWKRMRAGDVGLMYTEGSFHWAMRVHATEEAPVFARGVWGIDGGGETWKNTYFVDRLRMDVAVGDVAASLGYKPNWGPRGFGYVDAEKEDRILAAYGSLQLWVEHLAGTTFPAVEPARVRSAPDRTPRGLGQVGTAWRPPRTLAQIVQRQGPSNPNPDTVGRGVNAHRRLEAEFGDFLRSQGREPLSPRVGDPNFDVAWRDPGLAIAEMKSLTRTNETQQLRTAIGEIVEFAARVGTVRTAPSVRKVIVVEQEPSAQHWVETCDSVGIQLVWPGCFEKAL